jgi:hypothetical protein
MLLYNCYIIGNRARLGIPDSQNWFNIGIMLLYNCYIIGNRARLGIPDSQVQLDVPSQSWIDS